MAINARIDRRTARPSRDDARRPVEPTIRLRILDAFRLTIDGRSIELPHPAKRLVALLAVRDHPLLRSYAAAALWLDHSDDRAGANLRSVLWRLRQRGLPIIVLHRGTVELDPAVRVDLREAIALARRWLACIETEEDREHASAGLEGELLPDWDDDWVLLEAEDWRQLRLHALEGLAGRLAAAGRWSEAVGAACAAVRADPLRESARASLIQVHLAEGNQSEAVREFARYQALLHVDLGLEPTPRLRQLIDGLHSP